MYNITFYADWGRSKWGRSKWRSKWGLSSNKYSIFRGRYILRRWWLVVAGLRLIDWMRSEVG